MTAAEQTIERPMLKMQRIFDAPRSLVWLAWTRPDIMVQWLGPVEWPAVKVMADFRIGGAWRACLKSPETGEELWQGGVFKAIWEPELLVFTFKWEGDNHEDGAPVDTLVTVELKDTEGGKTLMDFTHEGLKSEESVAGHRHGWNSTADRLEAWLAANPD